MKRAAVILVAAVVLFGSARTGHAEEGERAVGLEGALVLPGFGSEDPTAFALATWGLGAFGRYGLLDDLDLDGRFSFASYGGTVTETRTVRGRSLAGQRRFGNTEIHLELGARYKLLAGYPLAPYVELVGGFLWSVYRDQQFLNDQGQNYGLEIADRGESGWTLGCGLALDYRLFDRLFVGVAMRYVTIWGATAAHAFRAPVQISYAW